MFSDQRHELRQVFFDCWQKFKNNQALEPLENAIVAIIQQHPEYHAVLDHPEEFSDKDFLPEIGETNPFLHLSMHLAVQEQITTDRPAGIRWIFQQLMNKLQDPLLVEHHIIEYLAETLWQAQRNGTSPNEQDYLKKLQTSLE